ncbi:Zinc finger ccch domain-containing protein [Thalictrum thalictroides]|uniref:Zinc finger ccch domain-containing protein n=1 Tax=Thalictrum thalictroides TaxID=46969 RepID=A0A7J6VGG6_THATH|nr:Zinc finger ccch domain-containing protein [Thalictrum thalictroides]
MAELETLNPSLNEQIQPPSLQSTSDGDLIDHLQKPSIKSEEAAEEEEIETTDKIQQSELNVVEKRKREDNEEEEGNENGGVLIPMWKTSLCSYYRRQDGSCSHGETCRYAHGEAELRPRPDNSWDPTSERAKKVLKSEKIEEKIEVLEAREDVLMMTDAVVDSTENPGLNKCLVNLPRKWTSDLLKKFLDEEGVIYKSAKKKKGMTVGFATFETADQVENAIEVVDGKSMGNKQLKVADVLPRLFEKKTQSTISLTRNTNHPTEAGLASGDPNVSVPSNGLENVELNDNNDPAVNNEASKSRSVREVVTPLAHMPYADQLEHKKKTLEQTLKKLTRNARKACPEALPLPEWVLKSKDIGGLPCKLEGIIESPLVNGYRNKCEFSVGYSLQRKPTVGFMLGNFREGVTAVEEPTDCPNVSMIACKFASTFQEFLQVSGLPIWNRLNNTGFWRLLMVREGRSHSSGSENIEANITEVMLMVQICSVDFDDELVKSELQRLARAFADGASANSPSLPLTSLVVQDHKGISNVAPADAPLYPLSITKTDSSSGQVAVADDDLKMRIHDYISSLCFSISPTAFFQVNTLAAEKLYALAGDWASLGPDTLLFDICCGTGTIGLTLAHRVGMVVGIEMNASAVLDAHRNAEINGIKNCRFVCGKAEDVMGSILKEYLNVPDNQEETLHMSDTNAKDDNDDQDNDASVGNDTVNHGNGDVKSASDCAEHSVEELEESEEKYERIPTTKPQYRNVVAIVDPPRVGLHPVVIKALRTHPRLRRLVYISCNPESLVANAIELCTPSSDKTDKGNNSNRGWRNMSSVGLARRRTKSMPESEPFRPVKAMAVDLFPHTPHCELVMLLER